MTAKEARTPAEVLATNVRDWRVLRRLRQRDVAERMRKLGHRWHAKTVSVVESNDRAVTTDELIALALVLGVTLAELLDPDGPDPDGRASGYYVGDIDYPDGASGLSRYWSSLIAHSTNRLTYDGERITVDLEGDR